MFSKSILLRAILCFEILLLVSASGEKQRYCGPSLTQHLSLFCQSRYASPISNSNDKRSGDSYDYGLTNDEQLTDISPFSYQSMPFLANFGSERTFRPRTRREFWFIQRGVSDECCRKPCTIEQLKRYCGT